MLPGWCRPVLSTFVSPLVRIILFYILVCCYNFCSVLVNRHHVLKMCRWFSVFCTDRPSVLLLYHILGTHIDHRLDRENHPRNDLCTLSPLSVIRNFRVFVKISSHAVSYQFADHSVSK